MSQENVDVVRGAFAAWNRRDFNAWVEAMDPDVEVIPLGAGLEGDVYRGEAGALAMWEHRGPWGAFEAFEIHPDEFREVGDHLVVLGHWDAVSRSGLELSVPGAWVVRLRDGRIVRWQAYTSREAALDAAELPE